MSETNTLTSIYIVDTHGNGVYGHDENIIFESSSTIKVVILYLALRKSWTCKVPLNTMFAIELRHMSNGSGIINWTDWKRLTLADLITYITTYSDCVATNILIEFVGGKRAINNFLKARNDRTRLCMPMLNFPEQDSEMPNVGMTTAQEMTELFILLESTTWPSKYQLFIREKLAVVHMSWFEEMLPKSSGLKIWHKTGSMINVGKYGDTVFNVAGLIKYKGREYYFALMSRTQFAASATDSQILHLKQSLVRHFVAKLEEFISQPNVAGLLPDKFVLKPGD